MDPNAAATILQQLRNALTPDNSLLDQARQFFNEFLKNQAACFVLLQVLTEQPDAPIRHLSCTLLRQAIFIHWKNFDLNTRTGFAETMKARIINETDFGVLRGIAELLTTIYHLNPALKDVDILINFLKEIVTNNTTTNESSLQNKQVAIVLIASLLDVEDCKMQLHAPFVRAIGVGMLSVDAPIMKACLRLCLEFLSHTKKQKELDVMEEVFPFIIQAIEKLLSVGEEDAAVASFNVLPQYQNMNYSKNKKDQFFQQSYLLFTRIVKNELLSVQTKDNALDFFSWCGQTQQGKLLQKGSILLDSLLKDLLQVASTKEDECEQLQQDKDMQWIVSNEEYIFSDIDSDELTMGRSVSRVIQTLIQYLGEGTIFKRVIPLLSQCFQYGNTNNQQIFRQDGIQQSITNTSTEQMNSLNGIWVRHGALSILASLCSGCKKNIKKHRLSIGQLLSSIMKNEIHPKMRFLACVTVVNMIDLIQNKASDLYNHIFPNICYLLTQPTLGFTTKNDQSDTSIITNEYSVNAIQVSIAACQALKQLLDIANEQDIAQQLGLLIQGLAVIMEQRKPPLSVSQELLGVMITAVESTTKESVIPLLQNLMQFSLHYFDSNQQQVTDIQSQLTQRSNQTYTPNVYSLRAQSTSLVAAIAKKVGRDQFNPYLSKFNELAVSNLTQIDNEEVKEFTYSYFCAVFELYGEDGQSILQGVMQHILQACMINSDVQFTRILTADGRSDNNSNIQQLIGSQNMNQQDNDALGGIQIDQLLEDSNNTAALLENKPEAQSIITPNQIMYDGLVLQKANQQSTSLQNPFAQQEQQQQQQQLPLQQSQIEQCDVIPLDNGVLAELQVNTSQLEMRSSAIFNLGYIARNAGRPFAPYLEQSYQATLFCMRYPHEDIRSQAAKTMEQIVFATAVCEGVIAPTVPSQSEQQQPNQIQQHSKQEQMIRLAPFPSVRLHQVGRESIKQLIDLIQKDKSKEVVIEAIGSIGEIIDIVGKMVFIDSEYIPNVQQRIQLLLQQQTSGELIFNDNIENYITEAILTSINKVSEQKTGINQFDQQQQQQGIINEQKQVQQQSLLEDIINICNKFIDGEGECQNEDINSIDDDDDEDEEEDQQGMKIDKGQINNKNKERRGLIINADELSDADEEDTNNINRRKEGKHLQSDLHGDWFGSNEQKQKKHNTRSENGYRIQQSSNDDTNIKDNNEQNMNGEDEDEDGDPSDTLIDYIAELLDTLGSELPPVILQRMWPSLLERFIDFFRHKEDNKEEEDDDEEEEGQQQIDLDKEQNEQQRIFIKRELNRLLDPYEDDEVDPADLQDQLDKDEQEAEDGIIEEMNDEQEQNIKQRNIEDEKIYKRKNTEVVEAYLGVCAIWIQKGGSLISQVTPYEDFRTIFREALRYRRSQQGSWILRKTCFYTLGVLSEISIEKSLFSYSAVGVAKLIANNIIIANGGLTGKKKMKNKKKQQIIKETLQQLHQMASSQLLSVLQSSVYQRTSKLLTSFVQQMQIENENNSEVRDNIIGCLSRIGSAIIPHTLLSNGIRANTPTQLPLPLNTPSSSLVQQCNHSITSIHNTLHDIVVSENDMIILLKCVIASLPLKADSEENASAITFLFRLISCNFNLV
ncbi:MAG: hypothetical protein EZS28_005074 [Streblomastix strix]|uniref:Uncharacterized protein n=1 Tax=Streblomastix strix TaxID=222440 RepID=A0A5J4WWX2_9EUKA|nr:MAG: hypothetical protein EZS28_005072 [Streblomastix strix]KAA6399401.1 MAG: hypothetical protein EZS28_005074 [Streblomastix strix]